MKYFIPFLILLASCSASRKASESDQDIIALNNLMAEYIIESPVATPFTVPGGLVALQAPCADFDSGVVRSAGGKLQVKCPELQVNADSLVRNNALFKLAITGRALVDTKVKLQEQRIGLLVADNKRLSGELHASDRELYWWRIGFAAGAGVIVAGLIAWLVFKFKSGGFKLFRK